MFDGRWRHAVDRRTGPVGDTLQRIGVTADVLTATGLLSAGATAWAIGSGRLHLGIVLLIVTGMHDLFDGPVAKASGTSSTRGAFFDSVTDRVADALLLGGVAWYLLDTHPGHLVLLPMGVLAVTSLVSYQRAKAESLGVSAKGGLMERAERMILLGVGLLSASFLVPVLWVMLGLTSATAVGRFAKIWSAADAPVRPAVQEARRRRAARWAERRRTRGTHDASRWRARRRSELSSRAARTRGERRGLRTPAGGRRRTATRRPG